MDQDVHTQKILYRDERDRRQTNHKEVKYSFLRGRGYVAPTLWRLSCITGGGKQVPLRALFQAQAGT